jgi:hypothetical protein
VDVLYLGAPSFDIEESKDDFGDSLICFYLYFDEDSISNKLSAYSEQISDEGYSVDFETISQQEATALLLFTIAILRKKLFLLRVLLNFNS